MFFRSFLPPEYREPYRICVVRAEDQERAELYRAHFQRRLPTVRVPLRDRDEDVKLELQPLIDAAYVNGRYGEELTYAEPPHPELSGPDAEWADQRLHEKGLR
jgi:hypothetical protein